jgi:hypothetical protein
MKGNNGCISNKIYYLSHKPNKQFQFKEIIFVWTTLLSDQCPEKSTVGVLVESSRKRP